MTAHDEAILAERCQALRGQLRANRRLIVRRFDDAKAAGKRYPRSVTMRLLRAGLPIRAPAFIEAVIVVLGSPAVRRIVGTALTRLINRFATHR